MASLRAAMFGEEQESLLLSLSFWSAAAEKLAASHDYYERNRGRILRDAATYRAAKKDLRARKEREYRKEISRGSRNVRSRVTSGNRYIFGGFK